MNGSKSKTKKSSNTNGVPIVKPSTSCEKSKSSIASSDHTSVENREAESPECKFAAVRYTNLALCIHYICI